MINFNRYLWILFCLLVIGCATSVKNHLEVVIPTASFQINDPASFTEGKIVFVANEGHGYRNLYLMNGDGSDMRRLTFHAGNDYAPTWSPDGKRIAFLSDWEGVLALYMLNLATTEVSRQNTQRNPSLSFPYISWSPDDRWIVYSDGLNIYLIALDSGEERQITMGSTADYHLPWSWSADGQSLLFSSVHLATVESAAVFYYGVINIYSNEVTQIMESNIPLGAVTWPVNGELLIYEGGIKSRLLLRSDFNKQQELLIPNEFYDVVSSFKIEKNPDWLPDSQHVVLSWNGPTGGELAHIYILNVYTLEYLQLTPNNLQSDDPAWWWP